MVSNEVLFFEIYYPTFTVKLSMNPCAFDTCFLFQTNQNVLSGVSGISIDDSLNTGTLTFEKQEEKATSSFITRKKISFPMRFLGLLIEKEEDVFLISQDFHINKLQTMNSSKLYHNLFRTIRGQLLFISKSSRPDVSYAVSQLCQIPLGHTKPENIKYLNHTVSYLKKY